MGKSTILSIFQELGATVLSADAVVARLWAHPETGSRWASQLGVDYPVDTDVLRIRLADPRFRTQVAKVVQREVLHILLESQAEVIEVPVLFEACVHGRFATVVVAVCPEKVQLERLMVRLGKKEQSIELIRAQLPSVVKVAFADFVVDTSESLDATKRQVEHLLRARR